MSGEIKVVDYEGESPSLPSITQVFGGRLTSSEYVQMDDGKQRASLHKVHIDIVCDTRQYMALLKAMDEGVMVGLQLVN